MLYGKNSSNLGLHWDCFDKGIFAEICHSRDATGNLTRLYNKYLPLAEKMSELLDHLRNKENEHLDHILLELYERELASGNMQGWYSLNEIFTGQYNSQDYYVDILSREGYMISSYRGNHIELTITSYGKQFCETSSYSQPNVPIIKQM